MRLVTNPADRYLMKPLISGVMLASTWALNLGAKIRKGIYNLYITSTNLDCIVPGGTFTSVVWILLVAQLMMTGGESQIEVVLITSRGIARRAPTAF